MSALVEAEILEEPDFKWGKQRGVGGKNKDVRFYETFTYDGMDYALYDCVFMYKKDEPAPYIGKLVKIWENSFKSKKIKVQWFFRPWDISLFLGDAEVMENELFFASGVGTGLANINHLEAIAGKCNVVCISKDSRNLQPSAEEVQMADYVFSRTFDVTSNTISDQMGDTVGGLDVKYVFNRTESLRALDVRNVNPTGKDVIACRETLEAAGKNQLLQLKNVNPDENEDRMLGKEGTNANEMQVKDGGLLGEGSSGGNVNSSKIGKIKGITLENKNMLVDKNGSEKDKFKDIKSPVSPIKLEGVKKSARDSGEDLDNTRSKKAKLDGPVSSLEVKDVKHAQSLTSPGKDAPELDMNLDGSGNDVNLAGKSSFLDEKLLKTSTSSEKTPISGRAEDLNAFHGEQSKGNDFPSKNPESAHARDSVGTEKGKKLGENSSAHMKRPSKIYVGSPSEAERPVTPNGTPKSGSNKDFQGSGQAAKLVKNVNASTKRPLKRSDDLSTEKSNTRKIADYENMDKLADDSSPLGGPRSKKGKFEYTINKVSEKTCPDGVNNSLRLAANDNMTKSKLGKGASKEHLEGDPSNKGKFDDSNYKNNVIDNVKAKTCSVEIKNSPKVAAHEYTAKSNLGKGALKENFSDKVGKPSKNNLPTPSLVKCSGDDGKVGSRIFEVTRRPIVEKSNWMKLPWENKMKTAHDQGRLVLLQNLDPEYTSGEVEDIVWHAFKEESTAKMVQKTATSNPYSGQAFVIFKSREAVDRVVKTLEGGCLMLPNKRPLIVRIIDFPKFLEKQTFVGHLAIDKARRQRDMKEAVSTSHYSQNNTIEYEMAMAWCLLQSKSDSWWEKLYEEWVILVAILKMTILAVNFALYIQLSGNFGYFRLV
ncbi:hypothetical protein PHJA_000169900 [Phtheirospermum japonicum]|uniref:BAH domain-containing protein n=1 Tax=Phtheirospermum japonicum TaxID=374723 RepID=A0A830B837_9LAMI|nr:hypothetical protein PHJA_000169900 [Phtheirospermum japonicum]